MASKLLEISPYYNGYYNENPESYRDYMMRMAMTEDLSEVIEINTARQISANTAIGALISRKFTDAIEEQTKAYNQSTVENTEILNNTLERGFSGISNNISNGFLNLAKQSFETNRLLNAGFSSIVHNIESMTCNFVKGLSHLNDTFIQESLNITNKLDLINNTLNNKIKTEARELYNLAFDNSKKGFFQEAINDLLKAIDKNQTDYFSWYLLGIIYYSGSNEFGCVIDLDKSIECLKNAVKYIKPSIKESKDAKQFSSNIWYDLGISLRIKAKELSARKKKKESIIYLKEAKQAFNYAWEYSDNWLEAYYNSAKCSVLLNDLDDALHILEIIVQKDRNYASIPLIDQELKPIIKKYETLLQNIKEDILLKLLPFIEEIKIIISEIKKYGKLSKNIKKLIKKVIPENLNDDLTLYYKNLPYIDFLNLYDCIPEVIRELKNVKNNLIKAENERKEKEEIRIKCLSEAKILYEKTKLSIKEDKDNITVIYLDEIKSLIDTETYESSEKALRLLNKVYQWHTKTGFSFSCKLIDFDSKLASCIQNKKESEKRKKEEERKKREAEIEKERRRQELEAEREFKRQEARRVMAAHEFKGNFGIFCGIVLPLLFFIFVIGSIFKSCF